MNDIQIPKNYIFIVLIIIIIFIIYQYNNNRQNADQANILKKKEKTDIIRTSYKLPVEIISQPGIGSVTAPHRDPQTNLLYLDIESNYLYKPVYIKHGESGLYLSSLGGVAIGGGSISFQNYPTEKWVIGINSMGGRNIGLVNEGRTRPIYGFMQGNNYDGNNKQVLGLVSFCGGCKPDSINIELEIPKYDPISCRIKLADPDGGPPRALSITYEKIGDEEMVPLACVKKYDPEDNSQLFHML